VFCFILASRISPMLSGELRSTGADRIENALHESKRWRPLCVSYVEMRRAARGCPGVDLTFPNLMPTWL
jgi:hypothetical protein